MHLFDEIGHLRIGAVEGFLARLDEIGRIEDRPQVGRIYCGEDITTSTAGFPVNILLVLVQQYNPSFTGQLHLPGHTFHHLTPIFGGISTFRYKVGKQSDILSSENVSKLESIFEPL